MDVAQLKYFLKVAELEHMSQAAEALNISQPALSSNIRKLEAELGTELFIRHGRRIELNLYGTYLRDALTPVVEQLGIRELPYYVLTDDSLRIVAIGTDWKNDIQEAAFRVIHP